MNERVNRVSGGSLFSPGSAALLYAALAVVWILASGALLTMSVNDPVLQQRLELGKGLLFVLLTSALLYAILRQWQNRVAAVAGPVEGGAIALRWRILACVVLLGIVPLAGFMVVKIQLPQVEREAFSNLAAIADLKVAQIRRWLRERHNDGEVIMAVAGLSEIVAALRQRGGKPAPGAGRRWERLGDMEGLGVGRREIA